MCSSCNFDWQARRGWLTGIWKTNSVTCWAAVFVYKLDKIGMLLPPLSEKLTVSLSPTPSRTGSGKHQIILSIWKFSLEVITHDFFKIKNDSGEKIHLKNYVCASTHANIGMPSQRTTEGISLCFQPWLRKDLWPATAEARFSYVSLPVTLSKHAGFLPHTLLHLP